MGIVLVGAGTGAAVAGTASGDRAARPAVVAPARAHAEAVAGARLPSRPEEAVARRPRPGREAASRRRDPQPHPRRHRRASISLYERTVDRRILHRQGCHAARGHVEGIVVLDFGQPAWNGIEYGTNLFSGRFAGNHAITSALLAYARGWAGCGRRDGHLVLARGTSNYRPHVPNVYWAGRRWAQETAVLARRLRDWGLGARVTAAAADDVEPAWDRTFRKTFAFYRGFRDVHTGHLLYDYGSLDGGVDGIWSARQAFFVASGMRYSRALPEIYNHAMAREWARLARIAIRRYHRPLRIAGLTTTRSAGLGLSPRRARASLMRALWHHVGEQAPPVPNVLTDIRAPF